MARARVIEVIGGALTTLLWGATLYLWLVAGGVE